MSFHHSNPAGRVLNRLSEDVAEIDYVVPFTLRSMINVTLQALASFGIIVATLHLFLIALLPLGIMYYFLQVIDFVSFQFLDTVVYPAPVQFILVLYKSTVCILLWNSFVIHQ